MKHVVVEIPKTDNITLELDDKIAPETIRLLIKCMPLTVRVNVWGDEIYTDSIPINAPKENEKSLVDLHDVAYWAPGNAVCLFYGPTPISGKNQIKPYSPVNVIGKIMDPDKTILTKIGAKTKATFRMT